MFSKFHGNLNSAPVRKDSYLPKTCDDLQTDISSPITQTKTLFVAKNCRVAHFKPVREPAGHFTSAELLHLTHFLEFKILFDSRAKSGLSLTDSLGAKAPPGLTLDCSPKEVMPVELSKTCDAALGTQASTEVDIEWKNSPDLMDSQVVFPQKKEVDFFMVRLRVSIAYGLAFG